MFGNQLVKECNTWTNARSIVRKKFVRQKFRERLCRPSNLFSRLCTLWTHSPAGVMCIIFFACSLPISENINSPLLFVLYFESSSTETSFWLLPVIKTGKTYPGVAASSIFQIHDRGGYFKVRLPLIKQPQLPKSQKNICCNTDLQICSCFNSLISTRGSKN